MTVGLFSQIALISFCLSNSSLLWKLPTSTTSMVAFCSANSLALISFSFSACLWLQRSRFKSLLPISPLTRPWTPDKATILLLKKKRVNGSVNKKFLFQIKYSYLKLANNFKLIHLEYFNFLFENVPIDKNVSIKRYIIFG